MCQGGFATPYRADLFSDLGAAAFTLADWKEFIGNEQPGGGEAFSLESGEATVVAIIDWAKARSFLRFVLGWSYADRGSPYGLNRENPQSHPRFAWLTASTVSFQSISPQGTSGAGTKVDGAYGGGLPTAAYKKILATVRFTDRPWVFLDDFEIASGLSEEGDRNTYFSPVPSVEVISAEGLNNIKFAEGSQRGVPIPAPFGTLMSKMTKTYNWMWVPHEYISGSDPTAFTPTKILNCVGRVNSDTFLGHPPGTLLLQAPAFQRFRFPLLTVEGIYGYYGWNVALPLQYFDPDRGGDPGTLTTRTSDTAGVVTVTGVTAGNPLLLTTSDTVDLRWNITGGLRTGMTVNAVNVNTGVVTVSGGAGADLPPALFEVALLSSQFRGHQLVPRRVDLKWYGCVREDKSSKLYPEAEFAQIFRHVDAP